MEKGFLFPPALPLYLEISDYREQTVCPLVWPCWLIAAKLEGGGKGRLCFAVNTATKRNGEEARQFIYYRVEVIMLNSGLVVTADSRVSFEVSHWLRVKSGDVFTMLANNKSRATGLQPKRTNKL